MSKAQEIYSELIDNFQILSAEGYISFCLKDISIRVKENDVVGNILEEWLYKWLCENSFDVRHNTSQSAPDFWLNPDDVESDLLEIKSFCASPSFDIAAFMSYINELKVKPWRLFSDYLIFQYDMEKDSGNVHIQKVWLKKVWEISSPSDRFPIKTQYKNKQIVNIRPATWYSDNSRFKTFASKEHFLAALEETIYSYPESHKLAETWARDLCANYKEKYKSPLKIPRWSDIKSLYGFA